MLLSQSADLSLGDVSLHKISIKNVKPEAPVSGSSARITSLLQIQADSTKITESTFDDIELPTLLSLTSKSATEITNNNIFKTIQVESEFIKVVSDKITFHTSTIEGISLKSSSQPASSDQPLMSFSHTSDGVGTTFDFLDNTIVNVKPVAGAGPGDVAQITSLLSVISEDTKIIFTNFDEAAPQFKDIQLNSKHSMISISSKKVEIENFVLGTTEIASSFLTLISNAVSLKTSTISGLTIDSTENQSNVFLSSKPEDENVLAGTTFTMDSFNVKELKEKDVAAGIDQQMLQLFSIK